MNKGRIIKTVIATSALVVLTSMTAFAKMQSHDLGEGIMYLDADTATPLKRAEAGTIPPNGQSTLTILTTTYDDGSDDVTRDGPAVRKTCVKHDWEYADGYSSIHKMIRNGLGYASGTLSY